MYDTLELGSGVDTATTPKERLIATRNFIAFLENPERKFDMRVWCETTSCDTARCIGGWIELLFNHTSGCMTNEAVGALVGLNHHQSSALFYPDIEEEWQDITSADAVKVLSHLIETGKVDWSVAGFHPQRKLKGSTDDRSATPCLPTG